MAIWLMKSEPSEYSIDHLERDGSSSWFGVRNYQARNYMRDSMRVGDIVLFYHSNCKIPGIAGIAQIASLPHDDITQFVSTDKHYDPKSTHEKAIWQCVDVGFVEKLDRVISLAELRDTKSLSTMKILQKGNRLSITPVTEKEYAILRTLIKA